MNQNEQLYTLLTDANEDCTPFWDAVWEVVVPGDSGSEVQYEKAIPQVQWLMQKLLLSGLVVVYRGDRWPPSADHEIEVTQEQAEEIIADTRSWRRPSDEEISAYFCFYATATGKQVWHKGRESFCLSGAALDTSVSVASQPAT